MFKEEKRQAVHIVLLLFAFVLKYVNFFGAVILILGLLIFVSLIVPKLRVRRHFYRPAEKFYSHGAVSYFLVLLILVLVFPGRLYIVAASWAILALGDGLATAIGQNFKTKELAWNKNKSYIGTLAFILFGTIGCYVMLKWMTPELGALFAFSASWRTALVAGIIESLPWRINDNISVPLSSAVTLYFLLS